MGSCRCTDIYDLIFSTAEDIEFLISLIVSHLAINYQGNRLKFLDLKYHLTGYTGWGILKKMVQRLLSAIGQVLTETNQPILSLGYIGSRQRVAR